MIRVVRAKLHGIRVTHADLNYHGSITLDPAHCELAGILPLEFVEIWNKCSGARISTYVIFGERNSRCCILNGAAARSCQSGDEIIVAASEFIERRALVDVNPVVLTFEADNTVQDILHYRIQDRGSSTYEFDIVPGNHSTIKGNAV